jgi:UDP-perosamine 4-acetyltransferase
MENSNENLIQEICVIGNGGHAQSTFSLIANITHYEFMGFYEELANKDIPGIEGCRSLGSINDLVPKLKPKMKLAIGIGYSLTRREYFFEKYFHMKAEVFPTLIHPNARIDQQTNFGAGVHIHTGGIVRIGADIGNNVLVNSGAVVDHDVSVGSHSMISPGAILCGRVKIGARSFVGAGAIILPGVEIGDSCVIGAGTLVSKSVPSNMMCMGNPGRVIPISDNARKILGTEL